jgi:hypothetical protein
MSNRRDWKQWTKGKKKYSTPKNGIGFSDVPVKCLSSNEAKSYYKKRKKNRNKEYYKNRIKHKKIEIDFELYDWKPTELDIFLWKNT